MRSSITYAILNLVFGVLFTFFAIQQVNANGWGFFSYLLLLFATIDIGSGLKILFQHFTNKGKNENGKIQ
jgi:hypothetical protein